MEYSLKPVSIETLLAFAAQPQPEVILCKRCGRTLTDEHSRQVKIGPICAAHGDDGVNYEDEE